MRSSASNSLRGYIKGVRGLRTAISQDSLAPLPPCAFQSTWALEGCGRPTPHSFTFWPGFQMLTGNKACEPSPQVFKSRFYSALVPRVFQWGVKGFVFEADLSEREMKINV